MTNLISSDSLNYSFLLLVHVICADQQIDSRESKALQELASQARINQITLQSAEKILAQDEDCLSIEQVAQKISLGQRIESLRQVLAIAYIDGYFSPLERELVNQITQWWGIHKPEVNEMLEAAQGFGQTSLENTEDQVNLSIGARLLQGAESLLSQSLVSKLAELAPENIGKKVEQLQREILLSGPEYGEAIERCAKIANDDYRYAEKALKHTCKTLQDLAEGIQKVTNDIQQNTRGKGKQTSAKEVTDQLAETRQTLFAEILKELETIREALKAKQRALNHFSIAFMGKTKAGKSTLHAIVTGQGWDAIGIGKQRTTRYNRVYDWKNIRIIDTPGIGAPGGKTDEEVAKSIIEEADVICYVVTNDSIQETEFEFLKVLKEKTKPLTILLNLQYNLRDKRRLDNFLSNPDRFFAKEESSGIGGHIERIERYAREHYANDYLDIIPVMLLAAQLAQEPEHKNRSKQLFQASRVQDFLDSIRTSLIEHGAIRRSQTLLGSTVGAINTPYKWISTQGIAYQELAERLKVKQQKLKTQLQKAEQDVGDDLCQKVKAIFQDALNAVPEFAEEYWQKKEDGMERGWKHKLQEIQFEQQLKAAPQEASQSFQDEVEEALEEIGNELKIIAEFRDEKYSFSEQDSSDFNKKFIGLGGAILGALLACAIPFFPPIASLLGIFGTVLGIGSSLFSNMFKSKEQKRREAVENISISLENQLEDRYNEIDERVQKNFEEYCQSVTEIVDKYFDNLIQSIENMAMQLKKAEGKLKDSEDYLNRAYAKRIIDWASDQYEPLDDIVIKTKIRKVERDFGKEIKIFATSNIALKKSLDDIQRILQESVSIQTPKN